MTDQDEHQDAISAAEAVAQHLAQGTVRTGGTTKPTGASSAVRTGYLSGAVSIENQRPPKENAAHAARLAFGNHD